MAKRRVLASAGLGGLPEQFAMTVSETALGGGMGEHLRREKYQKTKEGRAGNARNGTVSKTVATDAVGPVHIEVPCSLDASCRPMIVRKRQRWLNDVDEVVLSLYARGLTTGEISAHFREIYGASVSRETAGRITDRVVEEISEWASRPLDAVYAAVFVDAIRKSRCGTGRSPTGRSTRPSALVWMAAVMFWASGVLRRRRVPSTG